MPEAELPEQIRLRLAELDPRAAQTLVLRCVDGKPRPECARFYGVHADAFDVKLFRAASTYAGRMNDSVLSSYDEEWAAARALGQALESGDRPKDPLLGPLFDAIRPLREHATAIREHMIQAERRAATSPAGRREDWARRFLILAILAITAYFYLRSR